MNGKAPTPMGIGAYDAKIHLPELLRQVEADRLPTSSR
jgi:hypothetical protein